MWYDSSKWPTPKKRWYTIANHAGIWTYMWHDSSVRSTWRNGWYTIANYTEYGDTCDMTHPNDPLKKTGGIPSQTTLEFGDICEVSSCHMIIPSLLYLSMWHASPIQPTQRNRWQTIANYTEIWRYMWHDSSKWPTQRNRWYTIANHTGIWRYKEHDSSGIWRYMEHDSSNPLKHTGGILSQTRLAPYLLRRSPHFTPPPCRLCKRPTP